MLIKRTEDNGIVNALYESSNILSSKYDGKDLTIIFKRGASYTYNDVSKSDYTRFEMADSQGQILNSKIKAYSFSKNDVVNEIPIINEINEAKEAELTTFEKGIINYMKDTIEAYDRDGALSRVAVKTLAEMIIKHNELAGTTSTLKLCACD